MELIDFIFGEYSYPFFITLLIILLTLLVKIIGKFPIPLPLSENPKREVIEVIVIWFTMFIYLIIFIFVLNPLFLNILGDSYYIGLIFGTIINFIIPFIYVIYKNKWMIKDLRLNIQVKSWPVAIFSIVSYTLLGIYNFFRLEPMQIYWYYLLLLFYSNAFLEEFFFRAIVQSKFEKALGQQKAIIYQAILFMLIHIPANITTFTIDRNLRRFIWNFCFQLVHGAIFGVIFIKTRNLWPSVICHFLNNWTGSIIVLFF